MKRIAVIIAILASMPAFAQTASSLFWKKDNVQLKEIVSDQPVQYNNVGHHGPAVENSHMALRIYFNDSGAIDIYSKSGKQMELLKYLWYPTEEQQAKEGAGCDEYLVGKTVGVGGIALWDGQQEIKLVAKSRTARVGETKKGAFAEIIAYGVQYKGESVDISIRVDVFNNSRKATVTATELNGKKVQFLTGINYQPGEDVAYGKGWTAVWGVHPADVSQHPTPLGAGMNYKAGKFLPAEKTADMVRIISKPAKKIQTTVVCASTKEDELNNAEKFRAYMSK